MKFPKDALHRLMRREKAIIGVNYPTKSLPPEPTAAGLDEEKYYPYPGMPEVEEVHHLGFGLMLIDLKVLREKNVEKPYFACPYIEEAGTPMGEDVFFAKRMREYGISTYVDNELSMEVSHIGKIAYEPYYITREGAQVQSNEDEPLRLGNIKDGHF